MQRYLLTLQVTDRKGLVEQIAHAINHHHGNWLNSELHHMDGIFAAIILLEVPKANWETLLENIECIEGISLTYQAVAATQKQQTFSFTLVANDRLGLVKDVANVINSLGHNIEKLSTTYESASHSGTALFKADICVNIGAEVQTDTIIEALYKLGNDVQIDLD